MIIDWKNTYVLLLGTSEYKDSRIPNIPNVKVNIQLLKKTFRNPEIIGINNIIDALDVSRQTMLRRLNAVLDKSDHREKTLIIYYAGHGIVSPKNGFEVFLGTRDIDETHPDINGLGLMELKKKVENCNAGRKILIVDACHSGQLIGSIGSMGSHWKANMEKFVTPINNNQVSGFFILTSAGEHESALYPVDKPKAPTYFTEKLIDIFQNGINSAGEYLTLQDVYSEIKLYSLENKFPEPLISAVKSSSEFRIAVNRKYSSERKEFEFLRRSRASIQRINEFSEKTKNEDLKFAANRLINETKEANAWKRAQKKNTEQAFRQFLKNYPASRFQKDVENRLTNIRDIDDWYWTKKENTIRSYKDYIKKYPEGRHTRTARKRISKLKDEEYWLHCFSTNTRRAYLDYLSQFPDGDHVEDAMRKVEQLKAKNKLLRKAFKNQSTSPFDLLLQQAELAESKAKYKLAKDLYYNALTESPANPYIKKKLAEMRHLLDVKKMPKQKTISSKHTFPSKLMLFSLLAIVGVLLVYYFSREIQKPVISKVYKQAQSLENQKKYQQAFLLFQNLYEENSTDSIEMKMNYYNHLYNKQKKQILLLSEQFRLLIKKSKFGQARVLLDSLKTIPNTLDLVAKLKSEYELVYKDYRVAKFNSIMEKADEYAKNEATFNEALRLYKKAFSLGIHTKEVKEKIETLNFDIDEAFESHIRKGKKFLKSRVGDGDAKREFLLALHLKPNDKDIIDILENLKFVD